MSSRQLSEEEIYQLARKRVEEKKGFYIHLAVYIVVNIGLALLWWWTSSGSGHPWFIWTLAPWGLGLIFHGLAVFLFNKGSNWEIKEIEKEAERIKKSNK